MRLRPPLNNRVRRWPSLLTLLPVVLGVVVLGGCRQGPSPESQRLDRLELRLDQLEQRLSVPSARNTADTKGKPPAGVVKSVTMRTGTSDDRLRIYWADGSNSDLPCTKEQNTWACG